MPCDVSCFDFPPLFCVPGCFVNPTRQYGLSVWAGVLLCAVRPVPSVMTGLDCGAAPHCKGQSVQPVVPRKHEKGSYLLTVWTGVCQHWELNIWVSCFECEPWSSDSTVGVGHPACLPWWGKQVSHGVNDLSHWDLASWLQCLWLILSHCNWRWVRAHYRSSGICKWETMRN